MLELTKAIRVRLTDMLQHQRSNLENWTNINFEDNPNAYLHRAEHLQGIEADIACLEQLLGVEEPDNVEVSNVHTTCETYELEVIGCREGFVTLGHGDKDIGLWWPNWNALDQWLRVNDIESIIEGLR